MEVELHELAQKYCDKEEKNRKFTYSFGKSNFIFDFFAKREDIL